MKSSRFHHLLLPAVAALSIGHAPAITLALGNQPSGGASTTHELGDEGYPDWFVADLTDPDNPAPYLLATGSSSGSWTQTLTFAAGSPNIQTGAQFLVDGLLEFSTGDFELSNLRQQIITPGWSWSAATIYDYDSAAELTGLAVDLEGATASYAFDPLTAGQVFRVVGVLEYTGPDNAPPTPVVISLSTVPEPGSALLGLAGAFVLLGRRHRQRLH